MCAEVSAFARTVQLGWGVRYIDAYLFLAETRSDRCECTRNTHLAIRPTVVRAIHQLVL
jgi:hypothetical protein